MEELIEHHKKERESELTKFSPLKEFLPQNSQTLPPPAFISNNNIQQPPQQIQSYKQSESNNTPSQNITYKVSEPNTHMDNSLYLKELFEKQNSVIKNMEQEIKELTQKYDKLLSIIEEKLTNTDMVLDINK